MTVARLPVRRFRMNMVFGLILVLFAVMLVRLGKLQLVDGARYAAEAEVRDVEAEPVAPEPEPEPAPDTAFPGVVAWQKVVLNTDRRCAATGEKIAAGEKAYLGICDDGRPGPVLKKAPEPA